MVDNNFENKTNKYDLFICSAGFDKRGNCIPIMLKNKNYKGYTIVFNIIDFYQQNINNAEIIYKYYDNKIENIGLYYHNPNSTYKILYNVLKKYNIKFNSVLIDITCFTHEHLLMLYEILINLDKKISFCYLPAKNYSFDESMNFKKWLVKGCRKSRSIIGYSGLMNPKEKNHIVLILGFEIKRTEFILNNFEYDSVTLLQGSIDGSFNRTLYDIGKGYSQRLEYDYNISVKEIDLINCDKCIIDLNDFIKTLSGNILFFPMSTKISTIALAKVILNKNNIQARYVPADEYNKNNYSEYEDNIIVFD